MLGRSTLLFEGFGRRDDRYLLNVEAVLLSERQVDSEELARCASGRRSASIIAATPHDNIRGAEYFE